MEKGGGAASTTSLYITAQIRSFKLSFSIAARAEEPPGAAGSLTRAGHSHGTAAAAAGGAPAGNKSQPFIPARDASASACVCVCVYVCAPFNSSYCHFFFFFSPRSRSVLRGKSGRGGVIKQRGGMCGWRGRCRGQRGRCRGQRGLLDVGLLYAVNTEGLFLLIRCQTARVPAVYSSSALNWRPPLIKVLPAAGLSLAAPRAVWLSGCLSGTDFLLITGTGKQVGSGGVVLGRHVMRARSRGE